MTTTRQGPPIDGGWGWVVVVASGLAGFCMIGIAKSFGILADELKEYFEASQYLVAMIFGVSAVLYTVSAPVSLILGERFTQRKIVMIGGAVGFAGMAASSLCLSLTYIICTFGICFGFGNGFLYGNTLVMVGKYFKKRRSLANGITLAGSSIGQFAVPPLLQYLINTYTIKGALLLLGGIYFNVTVFGALLRPLSSYRTAPDYNDAELQVLQNKSRETEVIIKPKAETKGDNPDDLRKDSAVDQADSQNHDSENMKAQSASLLNLQKGDHNEPVSPDKRCCSATSCTVPKFLDFSVLKNRTCLLYSFVMFFMFFGYFNFILFLPSIAKSRGIVEYEKAALVSICGVTDLIARVLCGFVSDLNLVQRYKIMSVCSVAVGLNIVIFTWSPVYWQMAVQSAIYGFFGGGYIMLVPLVLIDFVGLDLLPRALAPVLFLQGTGAAIGQVFLGWIRDLTGDFSMVLIICGVSNLIGGLSILLYPVFKNWEHKRASKVSSNQGVCNKPAF